MGQGLTIRPVTSDISPFVTDVHKNKACPSSNKVTATITVLAYAAFLVCLLLVL